MLQTGALIRELTVREVLTMVGLAVPGPDAGRRRARLTGIADIADRRTNKLSGGQTQRVRFALALVANPDLLVLDEPTVALDVEARRAFWATMRGFAAARQDRRVRHPLPRGGRRLRRPHRADGQRPGRRRRPDHRDQGPRRPAHDPGHAAGRRRPTELAALPGVRRRPSATARRRAHVHRLRRRRSARCWPRQPGARDIEIRGAGLEEAFLELDRRRADAPERTRDEHAAPTSATSCCDVPQPPLLHLLAGLPAGAVPARRRAATGTRRCGGIPFATYYMVGMVGWGTMAAVVAGGARIAAERPIGWNRQLRITPLPPRTYFARQDRSPATRWPLVSIAVLYVAGIALGVRLPAGAVAAR